MKRQIFTAREHAKLKFTAAAAAQTDGSAAATDSIGTIEGYALVWNVPSSDRGGYQVVLAPNSANFTDPTHALYHHDFAGGPLGDTATGTLRLAPDDYGVKVSIDLPNTQLGRDVGELVRTGRVGGMSFSMVGDVESSTKDTADGTIMTATAYDVDEVTVTAIPAFTETSIAPAEDDEADDDDVEDELSKKRKEESRKQYQKLEALRLSILKP